jgi:hypothetical protein
MGGRPTNEVARQREAEVWRLRRLGRHTMAEIAEELHISESAVCLILHRVEDRALTALTKEVGRIKAVQTAQLETAAAEAMRAWDRSLEDVETVKRVAVGAGADPEGRRERLRLFLERVGADATDEQIDVLIGALTEGAGEERLEQTVKGQSGNPALLGQFREALADIRKIWGLDAPQKIAPTDDKGDSNPILEALRLGMSRSYPTPPGDAT